MRRVLRPLAPLGILFVFAPTALGADCPAIDPPRVAAANCPAIDPVAKPAAGGLRIFLDRRTGRVRPPTVAEARALVDAAGRGVEYLEPLEVVVFPDGMRSVDLKGAFEYRIEVRRAPDGTLRSRCVPGDSAEPQR
jgi:hypothetical protein